MPVLTPEATEAVCSDCHKAHKTKLTPAGKPRTPRGWKAHEGETYCADCWNRRYLLRAVSMPVAAPIGCTWQELRDDVKAAWRQTTRAANWIITELYAGDVRRHPGEEKMPPLARTYLYPALRLEFPALSPATVVALEQAITRKYRAIRYPVIWTRANSLPSFRYPIPVPVHNQSWAVRIEEDKPILSIRIGEARREMRLKSGSQFRRQLASVRLLARGEAIAGEAALYQRGNPPVLMAKMVAWLPRQAAVSPVRLSTLRVHTSKDSLLTAVNLNDEKLWMYHGDHLKRWSAEHRKQLDRWSDDQKYEQRPVPAFAQRREAAAAKYRNRMDSATHEIAAQLAGYAARRRFSAVVYDDSDQSFCEGLPWYRLRALIAEKVGAAGLEFEHAAGAAPAAEPEPEAAE